jgi:hypothetical protein
MYPIIQTLHSWWAFITLISLFVVVINSFLGVFSKREFASKDRTFSLIALIFSHIQLVFGLVVYFLSPLGFSALGQMSSATLRLTSMEHPLVGIIAIILITIGWTKHKNKSENDRKFKTIRLFYGLGLLLILSRIPWSLWF